ncbi:FAD binding domain-containing protein [Hirsutella rhossiliensis]|uniref:FAD binding domain-containing protein n=1 Tax=Hirsutella rhossiliensis TaxID=111463 RepID=A0A9P8MTF2_9HYPO|nr:FAD binding domain-containing protein [Hirsutella rhossiliensis]KAH0961097.1 FAD binding domain-containing protein [Hirsutella rhossiliensis]
MPLNILIVGAGVCGPALATLLQRSNPGHSITVVERSSSLRVAGQQIDLKDQGVQVVRKMGLMDTFKSYCVDETGLEILNPNGKPTAVFGINPSGQRRPTLTAEYEIMRGDVLKVLYEASLEQDSKLRRGPGKAGSLTYQFDQTISKLTQSDDCVEVTFSDGQKRRYDLVVGADGQGSRTRRLAFGQDTSDEAFQSLGVHAAYYSIPRIPGEGTLARAYIAPGRRLMITRTSGRPVTQVLLFTMKDTERMKTSYSGPVDEQKAAFAEAFADAGWQADRFLSGLKACNDFYAHEVGQIKMKQLYSGRVVLLGDAGYCPSPFTGMGTTGCLIGAYVLAGELARQGDDVAMALKAYDEIMRPPIAECQKMPGAALGAFFPSSQLGAWVVRNALWAMSWMDQVTLRLMSQEKHGWRLPEYPELNLVS